LGSSPNLTSELLGVTRRPDRQNEVVSAVPLTTTLTTEKIMPNRIIVNAQKAVFGVRIACYRVVAEVNPISAGVPNVY